MDKIEVLKGMWRVTSDPDAVLCANSIGSALAVAVLDQENLCAGLIVTPFLKQSVLDSFGSEAASYVALDTGLPEMFKALLSIGAKKELLKVFLIGSAQFLSAPKQLCPGLLLYKAIKKLLEKNGVSITGESVGGQINRNVILSLGDGRLIVQTAIGQEVIL